MLSRVADSLYWMSRYLERAEHTARLMDVQLHLTLDQAYGSAEHHWSRLLAYLRIPKVERMPDDVLAATRVLAFDANSSSIASSIATARENALQARQEISSEMWEQINSLYLAVKRAGREEIWNTQPHDFFQAVKQGAHLFQGITDSTMNHGEGWHFIQVGRFIERASATASLVDVHLRAQDESARLDDDLAWVALLKCCTAFEAYCKVYTADLRPERVASFLLLAAEFPHSLRFSVDRVLAALHAIAGSTLSRNAGKVERLAGRLRAELSFSQIDELVAGGLPAFLVSVQRQCAQIHNEIYQIYITYPIATALAR